MQTNNEVRTVEDKDINDVFDDILLIEERLIHESYKEGFQTGIAQENVEAFHLGYHRGAELGAELGYIAGIAESYREHFKSNTAPKKAAEVLQSLLSSIATFPRDNDPNTDLLTLADEIRSKFKKLCAILKIESSLPEADKLSF